VTSSKPFDIATLDPLTADIFNAPTSGERSARLREWLQTEPSEDFMSEVYRELSARDKGVAKLLKEKLDELKRLHGQEALATEWAQKAEQLLQAPRLNIADALAWQRDAAKAGAPLSREPLAGFKQRLTEVVKGVEDLQHQVMVQREAAVLLAQRIEVLSTKSLAEALGGQTGLQADVAQWQNQALALANNSAWPSVDLKYPPQLDAAGKQLQAVWDGFSAASALAALAQSDAAAPLPPVPVWADEIRRLRGELPQHSAVAAETAKPPKPAKTEPAEKPTKPKIDPAQRQALREQAMAAVTEVLEVLEKQLTEAQDTPPAEAVAALRSVLKTHGKQLDTSLDERLHKALTAGGDAEGWQRWLADQVRTDLVTQAEALLDANKVPTVGGRKMQDKLRQLRDSWKQIDQGGLPNHALWKRFDAACNEAYKTVLAWLEQMKKESADQRAQRVALMDEVKAWTAENAQSEDWRAQLRALHQFADRWRNAGHLSEKAFGEMQGQWKGIFKAAATRLETAQKASIERRQALINEAREVGAAPALRVDAVKALQQRWQVEAQSVPLDRKTEQKLWEVFRAPLDEAFQRKGTERPQAAGPVSAHDRAVIDASKSLDAANASGDAAKIRAAMAALDAALRGQALQAQAAQVAQVVQSAAPSAANPVAAPTPDASAETQGDEASAATSEAPADEQASEAASTETESDSATQEQPAAPVVAPKPAKPVVAVRGDDRPGQKRAEAPAGRDGRRDGRPGERGARPGGERGPGAGRFGDRGADRGGDRFGDRAPREDRGPRLGDTAFRAQREALERAEMSLRKLAAQAHGETLGRVLTAWQERQAEALPTVQELGKGVNATTRQAWAQAVSAEPKTPAVTALLRLEMAADVPTPADKLSERRALQLQLLTQRNQPGPNETWAQDVAQVLSGPHEESTARRLQNVLKNLLRS
jgi:ATP-dependent RNA helicase SUPV3L1/SUV3